MIRYIIVFFFPGLVLGQHQLHLQNPPAQTQMLGEGFLSTEINERDFAVSPDGNEIYFTVSTPGSSLQTIVVSKKKSSGWTSPEVVPFAGQYSDLEPAFSADGKTMFFSSNRPLNGSALKDFDIWKVTRTATGWSTPENLGSVINTTKDEFFPSVARNGNLYFTAAYEKGVGLEDIYVARMSSTGYQVPVLLDSAVNSKKYEFNAFVSADENYILFSSYGRDDDTGGGDLYISFRNEKGDWERAQNLKEINSPKLDYCPYVTADGKTLIFTSQRNQLPTSFPNAKITYKNIRDFYHAPQNGFGNLYWIDFEKILKERRGDQDK
jgi:Tol biopolymer transport system component